MMRAYLEVNLLLAVALVLFAGIAALGIERSRALRVAQALFVAAILLPWLADALPEERLLRPAVQVFAPLAEAAAFLRRGWSCALRSRSLCLRPRCVR